MDKYTNNINIVTIHKMHFLYNALEDGWTISKKQDFYTFKKKHKEEKEIYLESYLKDFIDKHLTIDRNN